MSESADQVSDLLAKFEAAFLEAREIIASELLSSRLRIRTGTRAADIVTNIDGTVGDVYLSLPQSDVLVVSEEHSGQLAKKSISDFKCVLILDPIDGTNNMLGQLPYALNVAIGSVTREKFTIGDIEAVLVADYVTGRAFRWLTGGQPQIVNLCEGGRVLDPPAGNYSNLYEVPDEEAYLPADDRESARRRQWLCLEHFRRMYPPDSYQRRAVDCTGIRMLEVYAGQLVAYGDVRRATALWDALPSIRLLLETGTRVVDGKLRDYSLDDIVIENNRGLARVAHGLTREIIVVGEEDLRAMRDREDAHAWGSRGAEPMRHEVTHDFFLSYSRRNAEEAVDLHSRLVGKDLRVYLYDREPSDEPDFVDSVLKAMRGALECLVLATQDSINTKWVETEFTAAWALGKGIRVVLSGVESKDLPLLLNRAPYYKLHQVDRIVEDHRAKFHPRSLDD